MTRQEEIADLAGKAGQLVKDLENLKKHAGLYSAAREDLQQTRASLEQFIEETKGLAVQTHQVLASLNEIGAGKIFERLGVVESRQKRWGILLVCGFLMLLVLNLWLLLRTR